MISASRNTILGAMLLVVASCSDATAPARETLTPPTALAARFAPELLVAVADADSRLLSALDANTRAPMHAALTGLHAALVAGDATRADHAASVVRALVAGHQGEHASRNGVGISAGDAVHDVGADGADLSALALLADAIQGGVRVR